MKGAAAVKDAFWSVVEVIGHGRAVHHWRKSGHPAPHFMARREIWLRSEYIEKFRDFASECAMHGIGLDEAKAAFIKRELAPGVAALNRADAAMVHRVILEMPHDEALHEAALKAHDTNLASFREECLAEAKRHHGRGGIPVRMRRVLRSRN